MATRSYAVMGLGQFGRHLALTLSRQGAEVLAIDLQVSRVEEIKDMVARAARLDCTKEDALRGARVQELDCAVLALGEADFEATALAVATLSALKVPKIIARSSSSTRGRILELVGATSVVFPEIQAAEQLSQILLHPGQEPTAALPPGFVMARVKAPASLVGTTLKDAALQQKFKTSVVAIRRSAERGGRLVDAAIEADEDEVIAEGDVLVVVGRSSSVDALGRESS